MRVLITGESGFIAKNLKNSFEEAGHTCIRLDNSNLSRLKKTGEVCIHRNSAEVWAWHMKNNNADIVVHNAAVVGTDVVALSPNEATLSNVTGTYNIVRACNQNNIPVCYMGTTVIYDTANYQESNIKEDSDLNPTTLYGILKLAGERVVTTHAKDWTVMRPLFAYGGVGDMNSLISKTIFAHREKRKKIDMFLDPNKIKDYLHVTDYCRAVVMSCEDSNCLGNDYNVASETPHVVSEIITFLQENIGEDLGKIVQWHPSTDYLGNHRLTSKKFRETTGWKPRLNLQEGIKKSVSEILSDTSLFNPLSHLDEAKNKDVDLTNFYNSNI
jgi:UDP-glucose 4-epimerase